MSRFRRECKSKCAIWDGSGSVSFRKQRGHARPSFTIKMVKGAPDSSPQGTMSKSAELAKSFLPEILDPDFLDPGPRLCADAPIAVKTLSTGTKAIAREEDVGKVD